MFRLKKVINMGTDTISRKLSRLYFTPAKAKKFAEPYAEKMRAKGYKVVVRIDKFWKPPACVVDVFCKK